MFNQVMAREFYEGMLAAFPPKSEEERMTTFVNEYEKLKEKYGYTIWCCGDAPACGSVVRVDESGFMQFKDLEINECFLREPWELCNDLWVKFSPGEAVNRLPPASATEVSSVEIVRRVRLVATMEPY